MFARMSRKSAVLFPCLAATFSSANKPTCKYLWEEALEEPSSLASSILNVDSNFESTHGMKITIMNYTDTSSIHGTVFEVIFYKRGRAFYQSLKHKREPIDLDFCRPSYKYLTEIKTWQILQRRLRYVLRKRRYWNTTDCVISSLQHVWKPLIQENFTKLSYLSQVDFCHSTSLLQRVIKIDLITNQLKSKFICDRSAHWIHFKIPLIFLFWKRQIMYLC